MTITKYLGIAAVVAVAGITSVAVYKRFKSANAKTASASAQNAEITAETETKENDMLKPSATHNLRIVEEVRALWANRLEDATEVTFDMAWDLDLDSNGVPHAGAVYTTPMVAETEYAWCYDQFGRAVLLIGNGEQNLVVCMDLNTEEVRHTGEACGNMSADEYVLLVLTALNDHFEELAKTVDTVEAKAA